MKSLFIVSVTLLLITAFTIIPSIHADEDEDKEKEDETGIGETEPEMESEGSEDDEVSGIPLGSGTGNIILYGTIAAIIAAIGYSGFKIIASRKKSSPKSQ